MANADHMYTTNLAEANTAIQNAGYSAEGQEGYVFPTRNMAFGNQKPVYRYFDGHDHFYCTEQSDKTQAEKTGYKLEGLAFYVFSSAPTANNPLKLVPLFRMFSKNDSDHFYTTAQNRTEAQKAGYVDEGQLGWVMSVPPTLPNYASPLFRLYRRGTSKSSILSWKTLDTILTVVEIVGKLFQIITTLSGGGGGVDTKTDTQGNTLVARKSA